MANIPDVNDYNITGQSFGDSGGASAGGSSGLLGLGGKAGGVGGAFSDFGTAASDLFAAQGDKASAADYTEAMNVAEQNANSAWETGKLQAVMEARKGEMVSGATTAALGGAGLNANSGSGLDLLRQNAIQSNLAQGQAINKGGEQASNDRAQASAYYLEADAAKSAAGNATMSGVMSAVEGVAMVALAL